MKLLQRPARATSTERGPRDQRRPNARNRLRPGLDILEDRLAPAGGPQFAVVQQPAAVQAYVGQVAVFSAVADAPGLSVRWQSSDDAGASWSDLPGDDRAVTVADATRTWYALATAPGQDGRRVRAVFFSDQSDPLPTAAAPLGLATAPSSIAVEPSASPRSIGEPMTVTVRVGAGAPGLPTPNGGLVRLSIGPLQLSGALVDGRAVFDVPDTLDPGAYLFAASYDGDAYTAAISTTLDSLAVQRGASRLDVQIPREAARGVATTLTAFVDQWMPEGHPIPGGVIFMDGGRPIDFVQLTRQTDGRYAAAISTSQLAVGDHYFQLVFLGNPRTYAASSGVYRLTVKPSGTTVTPGWAAPLGAAPASTSGSPPGSPSTFDLGGQEDEPFRLLDVLAAGLDDGFGLTLSATADGSLLAVGAFEEVVGGSGGKGSVSIYARSGDAWTRTDLLAAAGSDRFGFDVAMSADGSTLAVGAPLTVVAGRASQGVVYVYARSGGAWSLVQTLTATDGRASDRFGYSVAISGDGRTIAVGAERGGGVAQSANKVSAYVFARAEGAWSQTAEVEPAEGKAVPVDYTVGVELAADGATLLVSALTMTTPGGLAAIYSANAGGWVRDLFLDSRDFPGVVGLSGRTSLSPDGAALAAGARIDASPAPSKPAILLLTRSGSTWSLAATLTADADPTDPIGAGALGGSKLAFNPDGSTLLAGAHEAAVDGAANRGALHVFERSGSSWAHVARLTAADGRAGDNFGATMVAAGGALFVTAYRPNTVDGHSRGVVYAYRDARRDAEVAGPADQAVLVGAPATFTATASGAFDSVRWQVDDGGGWADLPGATDLVLTVRPGLEESGRRFRAVFRTASGGVFASEPATLTVVAHRVDLVLSVRDNPRRVGDPLLITVAARSATTVARPSGNVDLAIGAFRLSAALDQGVAVFSIPTTLAMGPHTATASYGGDGVRFGAAVASAPLAVVRGTSTLTAEIPTTATAGSIVRLTAVLGHSGTVATPGGGVMFMDGGRPIAFEQLSTAADGRVTTVFATAGLARGDHYFQLVYLGNPGTYFSSSPIYKLTIVPPSPSASDFSRISKASPTADIPELSEFLINILQTPNRPSPAVSRAFRGRMRGVEIAPSRPRASVGGLREGSAAHKRSRYLDLQ